MRTPRDRVRAAVDVEEPPHLRDPAGAQVADLVRVAAALPPGPERRRDPEAVLQRLVGDEVVVGRAGALRAGAPLAGEHRRAAEAACLVAGDLEGLAR